MTKDNKRQYRVGASKRKVRAIEHRIDRQSERIKDLKARIKILEDILFSRADLARFRQEK